MSVEQKVLIDRTDGVMTITLNRPHVLNALDFETHHALETAFNDYAADDTLLVAVITGAGERAFCAGSDLKKLAGLDRAKMPDHGYAGLIKRFDLLKPIVARVNGLALGGGLEIVLACDIVVAADHARFGLPEPKVGLAAAGGLPRLARHIPMKHAMKIALTGTMFDANDALAYGLVSQVVPAAELNDATEMIVSSLLASAPLALQATKQIMQAATDSTSLEEAHARSFPAYDAMLASSDAQEGMRAFNEKRKPVWTGK